MSAPTREQVETARELLASLGDFGGHIKGDDIAHLEVHGNEVVGSHLVPGLQVDVDQLDDGIEAWIHLDKGARIAKPVHMCFGMLPTEGLQRIVMHVEAEEDSFASVQAHCTFPNAVAITHKMDADVVIGPGATYEYFERHLHGPEGGVIVVPKTRVHVKEGGRFKTEFELIKGMAGVIDFDYEVDCDAFSTLDMIARIIGRGHDRIRINETGHLNGEGARAVLQSHLALRDHAFAEIYNTLTASAAARPRPRRLQGDRAGQRRGQGRAGGRGEPPAGARHARGRHRQRRQQATADPDEPRARRGRGHRPDHRGPAGLTVIWAQPRRPAPVVTRRSPPASALRRTR